MFVALCVVRCAIQNTCVRHSREGYSTSVGMGDWKDSTYVAFVPARADMQLTLSLLTSFSSLHLLFQERSTHSMETRVQSHADQLK